MKKAKPEYRKIATPKAFSQFLDGNGVLADRDITAERFDYNWHSRKLTFETHFRGHVLMQATTYRSTRDHQYAAKDDPLFAACGARVEISVSGLAQANKNRPVDPLVVMLQQVMNAVADRPHRRLRALDKETWQGIVHLLSRIDIFDAPTLKLPPKLRKWAADPNVEKASMNLHLRIDGERGAIKKIMLTPTRGPDSPYMNDLLGDLGQQQELIFVFDAGYWKLSTYHDIVDSGNDFVTKRGGYIRPRVVKELSLPEEPLSSGYVSTIRTSCNANIAKHQDIV